MNGLPAAHSCYCRKLVSYQSKSVNGGPGNHPQSYPTFLPTHHLSFSCGSLLLLASLLLVQKCLRRWVSWRVAGPFPPSQLVTTKAFELFDSRIRTVTASLLMMSVLSQLLRLLTKRNTRREENTKRGKPEGNPRKARFRKWDPCPTTMWTRHKEPSFFSQSVHQKTFSASGLGCARARLVGLSCAKRRDTTP